MSFALLASTASFGQITNTSKTIPSEAKALVKEFSENISVSAYQQKSTLSVLIEVAREYEKIENSTLGASEKTAALESLEKKKEYALRTILNDQQYVMLVSLIDE